MKCPNCGADLGEGVLPVRCPSCGGSLAGSGSNTSIRRQRASADRAAASRRVVEGLSGMGRGRVRAGSSTKRAVRLICGLALVAAFCAIVYVVAYQAELVGGRSVPDVVGWRFERAVSALESDGLASTTVEVASPDQPEGMVVSTNPGAGSRADEGSTVTVEVSSGASSK